MEKKLRSSRFRKKIFWIVFGLLVGFFLTINLVWLFSSIKDYKENYILLVEETLLKAREKIISHLFGEIKELTAFSQSFLEYLDLEKKKLAIERYLRDKEILFFISFANEKGKEIIKVSRKKIFTSEDLEDLSLTKEFYETKAGKIFISNVQFSLEGTPFLKVAIPLKSYELETKGMLLSNLSLRHLWEIISEVKIGKGGKIYIVDETGKLIADPNPSLVYKEINLINRLPVKNILSGKKVTGFSKENIYFNENEEKVLASGIFLPEFNWALILELPLKEIYWPIYQKIFFSILCFLLAILIAIFFAQKISLYLVRPIEEFRRGIEIIRKGNLGYQIKIKTGDEIEELVESFNQMKEELRQSQAQLEEAKTVLEIRVKARTKELEELAKGLDEKVKERTEELQKRIEELEKFHRLVVGRELKMIELKKKIKELKRKVGES